MPWALFGLPPVLSTENQQAYDKLRVEYATYYRPANTLHVIVLQYSSSTSDRLIEPLR